MRKGYRQIGKPKFDLRQTLDRLLRSHAPQTTVVRIFWRLSKVSCEGAKLLRTIAEKHTGRVSLVNQPNLFINPECNVVSLQELCKCTLKDMDFNAYTLRGLTRTGTNFRVMIKRIKLARLLG